MANTTITSNDETTVSRPEVEPSPPAEIDLQALAQKIMQLLKEEARLERERSGRIKR